MKKKDFIELTLDLYNLTVRFPNKEPLRYKIRGVGNEILSDLILITSSNISLKRKRKIRDRILENLEALTSFFEVSKEQSWVSPKDILVMKEEYSKIEEAVKAVAPKKVKPVEPKEITEVNPPKVDYKEELSEREERILSILDSKGKKAQLSDLNELFSGISRRTLIRDLKKLSKKGLIRKKGRGPSSFYQLVNSDKR